MLLRQFNWPPVPLCITALIIFEVYFKPQTVGWTPWLWMPRCPPETGRILASLWCAGIATEKSVLSAVV